MTLVKWTKCLNALSVKIKILRFFKSRKMKEIVGLIFIQNNHNMNIFMVPSKN